MALIKFGGGITAMSGSMAGNTFARNKYGNYVRSRTKPINRKTPRQVLVRNAMKSIADTWSEILTPELRQGWNEFAAAVPVLNKLGESIFHSGFNQFIRTNTALINAGMEIIDTAPAIFTAPAVDPTISAGYVASTQKVTVTFDEDAEWAKEDGAALLVYQGKPVSHGVDFFNGPWRFVSAIAGVASTGAQSPASLDSAYIITLDQKMTTQFRIVRADGRLSNFFRAPAEIVE
jgi:hypothetical protein